MNYPRTSSGHVPGLLCFLLYVRVRQNTGTGRAYVRSFEGSTGMPGSVGSGRGEACSSRLGCALSGIRTQERKVGYVPAGRVSNLIQTQLGQQT